jgi:hypothetical protein
MRSAFNKNERLPRVYLAGKISKNCWRNTLVTGLREHSWDDGSLEQSNFYYVGPFFVGCDHGCYHRPKNHGFRRGCSADLEIARSEIAALCRSAVRKADLLFAYITAFDCYGTLVEIAWAQEADIPVVIAFAPSIASAESNEMWFACVRAAWVQFDVTESDLPEVFARALRRYTL